MADTGLLMVVSRGAAVADTGLFWGVSRGVVPVANAGLLFLGFRGVVADTSLLCFGFRSEMADTVLCVDPRGVAMAEAGLLRVDPRGWEMADTSAWPMAGLVVCAEARGLCRGRSTIAAPPAPSVPGASFASLSCRRCLCCLTALAALSPLLRSAATACCFTRV